MTTRDTYHHGDLRNALLASATELIAEVGPDAFTLREAARRSGVNHRAAYRHFASKEDLLAVIAEQGYDALVEALRVAVAAVDVAEPEARLLALGVGYVRFAVANGASYAVMFGRRLNEHGRFPAIERPIRDAVALLAAELENGQARGIVVEGSVRDLGLSLWASLHGVASLVLSRRIRVTEARRTTYVATLLAPTIRGLCQPARSS